MITIANRKARPQNYAYSKPGSSSIWSSRNMGILGTVIFVYVVIHMRNFWYEYKFGSVPYMKTEDGAPILNDGTVVNGGQLENGQVVFQGEIVGDAMRDLYTVVIDGFENPILVAFYVLGMIAIAFHLVHGFQSSFQSLGLRNKKYSPIVVKTGYAFAIVVPAIVCYNTCISFFDGITISKLLEEYEFRFKNT